MIHHSCDRCQRLIGSDELRFIVRVEMQAAVEPPSSGLLTHSKSQLNELQEILEDLDPKDYEDIGLQALSLRQFDLCRECHTEYVSDPIGKDNRSMVLGFSKN